MGDIIAGVNIIIIVGSIMAGGDIITRVRRVCQMVRLANGDIKRVCSKDVLYRIMKVKGVSITTVVRIKIGDIQKGASKDEYNNVRERRKTNITK